jgi:Bacterial pre-peptidase C-terminal domain/PEP-CTERM motif
MKRFGRVMLRAGLAAMALGMAGNAQATNFLDQEPNETLATAQYLIHDGTINVTGFAAFGGGGAPSEVRSYHDWFRFDAVAGDIITLSLNAISPTQTGDPVLQFRNAAGDFLAFDDDRGPGANSLINFTILASGAYVAGVGEFGDNDNLNYDFMVTGLTPSLTAAVPEPASWAMMIAGFGLVGGALRSGRARPRERVKVSFAAG